MQRYDLTPRQAQLLNNALEKRSAAEQELRDIMTLLGVPESSTIVGGSVVEAPHHIMCADPVKSIEESET